MIEARRLCQRFGQRLVLANVALHVPPGSLLAIFGPNGAGKTTLLRILSLLLAPDSGEVWVCGRKAGADAPQLRRRIGLLSHQSFLYEGLSAWENLEFYARLYEVPDRAQRIRDQLHATGLGLFAADPVRTFSRGMLQRLALARALLHDPAILLLDEPYTGLDAAGRLLLDRTIAELKGRGRGILLVTHDLSEGLRAADQLLVLARGRPAIAGPAGEWPAERLATVYAELTAGNHTPPGWVGQPERDRYSGCTGVG